MRHLLRLDGGLKEFNVQPGSLLNHFYNEKRASLRNPELRAQARLAVKDEYIFDFLELRQEHSEPELEQALITRVESFLREMGGIFAFMGSQYRLIVGDEEFFIDLLLFHRRLRCLVAIDLKIGKFQSEFIGKMQFYLTALDKQVRQDNENPSIGIVLCKEKNRTVVEYALHSALAPVGVANFPVFVVGEISNGRSLNGVVV